MGLFCGVIGPDRPVDVDVDAAIFPCCFGRMTGLGSGGVP